MNRSVLLWAAPLLLGLTACPATKKNPAQSGAAPALALAVGANIRRQQRGDTLPNRPVPVLAGLWQQQRAEFGKSYREDAAGLAEDLDLFPKSRSAVCPNKGGG